jgi:branched-chain amino acid transport system permease protein
VSLAFGSTGTNIATLALLQVAAVLALATFSGNSGIVSFGHSAFMGIGAYVFGVLAMPKAIQASALPNLPQWLQGHQMTLIAALLVVVAVGLAVGILSGFPLARLSTGSAAIGTLAFLIIIHVTLIGARDFTRGSQTFYGVPRLTTVYVAFIAAALFILIARIMKETPLGLRLHAERDGWSALRQLPRRLLAQGFLLRPHLHAHRHADRRRHADSERCRRRHGVARRRGADPAPGRNRH